MGQKLTTLIPDWPPAAGAPRPGAERPTRIFGRGDRVIFRDFVRSRENAEILIPRSRNPMESVFSLSLQSIRTYMRVSFTARDMHGARFRIYPGFVRKPAIDAFAWEEGSTHLCGVTTGLVASLFEFCMSCFRNDLFFPEVGAASRVREVRWISGHTPGFWFINSGEPYEGLDLLEQDLPFLPADPSRRAAGFYMFHLSLRFIWLHEFYHCMNGHVGFLKAGREAVRLSVETAPGGIRAVERMRRCLEFGADSAAFWASCMIQNNDTENLLGIKELPKPLRLKLLISAVYGTTWILDEVKRRQRSRGLRNHPTAYSRLLNMAGCLSWDISPEVPIVQEINLVVVEELGNLSSMIPTIFGGGKLLRHMSDERRYTELHRYYVDLDRLNGKTNRYAFYNNKVTKEWLSLYKRGGVPPPRPPKK